MIITESLQQSRGNNLLRLLQDSSSPTFWRHDPLPKTCGCHHPGHLSADRAGGIRARRRRRAGLPRLAAVLRPLDSSTDVEQLPPHIDPSLFNFKLAWIEYVNRLVGVVVGMLILATALIAWRDHRRERGIFAPVQGALVAVAFQGWFGGQVVAHELDPRLVTVHLFVALLIVALLLYAAFVSFFPAPLPSSVPELHRRFARKAFLVIALVLVQVILGAMVRGSIDLTSAEKPDTARGLLLGEVGFLDPLHRTTGLLTLLSCWGLFRSALRTFPGAPDLRRLALMPALIASGQFAAGMGLAYLALPRSSRWSTCLLPVFCWEAYCSPPCAPDAWPPADLHCRDSWAKMS